VRRGTIGVALLAGARHEVVYWGPDGPRADG
jgi:hypothetical protein